MKKMMLLFSLFAGLLFFVPAEAQNINVNVNINLDRQPAWGPVGYDYVEYYYFPDINIYFDVMSGVFYYPAGNRWASNQYLPAKYGRYDLYGMYKVVINERHPWLQNKQHKRAYARYKNNRTQLAIRYSQDQRYHQSRQNHYQWVETPAPATNGRKTNSRTTTTTRESVSRSSSGTSSSTSRSGSNSGSGSGSNSGSSSSRTSTSRTR